MSYQTTNILHYRTSYNLLRIPEYMRWFDSTTLGGIYRLLSSKIYRIRTRNLLFKNDGGWVTKLAEMYDNGYLAAYCEDSEIRDSLCFTCTKSVHEARKTLVDLKLVKAEPFGKGYIYTLGIVVRHKDREGYTTGSENEAHYINRWDTWANDFEPGSKEMLAFRYYLAKNLASDKKGAKVLEELEKVFPDVEKNFSKILGLENEDIPHTTQQKQIVLDSPREVKVNEHSNVIAETAPTSDDVTVKMFWNFLDKKKPTLTPLSRSFRGNVQKYPHLERKFKDAILDFVPEADRIKAYPFFSYQLAKTTKQDETALTMLWLALREDVLGVAAPADKSKSFDTFRVRMKDILSKYSWDQIVWSFKNAMLRQKSVEFLTRDIFTVDTVIANSAANWKAHLEDVRAAERKVEAQNAREKVSEEEYYDYLKSASHSLVVESSKPEAKKETYDYWMKLAETAKSETTRMIFIKKAQEAKDKETTE